MGLCCGKDALPAVTDQGTAVADQLPAVTKHNGTIKSRKKSRAHSGEDLHKTPFDYVVPDDGDGSVVSPREEGGTVSGYSMASTLNRTIRSRLAVDVTDNSRAQYAEAIASAAGLEADAAALLHCFLGTSGLRSVPGSATGSLAGSAPPTAKIIPDEKQNYIDDAPTIAGSLQRVVEVEEACRIELAASQRLAFVMISLARQRVVPTIRQRKKSTTLSQVAPTADAVVGDQRQVRHADPHRSVLMIYAEGLESNVDAMLEREPPVWSPLGDDDGSFSAATAGAMSASASTLRSFATARDRVVEHYELLALDASKIDPLSKKIGKHIVDDCWDFLSIPGTTERLVDPISTEGVKD